MKFNFGTPTVTTRLTPSCTNSFGYELLTFTGIDGQPLRTPAALGPSPVARARRRRAAVP